MVTMIKKTVCLLVCSVLFSAAAFAGDLIEGSFTVNGGFSVGTLNPGMNDVDNTLLVGGRIQVDYAAKCFLAIGLETGFSNAQIGNSDFSMGMVPIMARIAWHPFTLKNIDPYLVGKAGYVFGFWTKDGTDYDWKNPHGGFVWGINLGTRFFFTQNIGIFIEAGYECQSFEWDHPGMETGKWDDSANGRTYGTIGFALRFGR
jgi:hypothetical protein